MMGGIRTQFAGDIRKTGSPVHPARLAQEVREFLPRDAALVIDGGDIEKDRRITVAKLTRLRSIWSLHDSEMAVVKPTGP
jgi:hypothetical protein